MHQDIVKTPCKLQTLSSLTEEEVMKRYERSPAKGTTKERSPAKGTTKEEAGRELKQPTAPPTLASMEEARILEQTRRLLRFSNPSRSADNTDLISFDFQGFLDTGAPFCIVLT